MWGYEINGTNIFGGQNRRDEQGVVLVTVLLVLSVLLILGVGTTVSVQNDLRTSANMRLGMTAGYLAEAGLESSKQQILKTANMPPVLSAPTGNLSAGEYSVSVLSSLQTGPLRAAIELQSIGKVTNARQAVHARITKRYDLADAAIVLRGNARGFKFTGQTFSISGVDEDLSGLPVGGARARAAVSVGSKEILQQIENALETTQKANLVGDDGLGSSITVGRSMPAPEIDRIATELCSAPDTLSTDVPASGDLSIANETWGDDLAPKVRCIRGLPGTGDTVTFSGNAGGAGVLIVRDAELMISGPFRWQGWIIVSGNDVGFRATGLDEKMIVGALVVAESSQAVGSGPLLMSLEGSLRISFSRQAFDMAASVLPSSVLITSYGTLPALLEQDYWRSLIP